MELDAFINGLDNCADNLESVRNGHTPLLSENEIVFNEGKKVHPDSVPAHPLLGISKTDGPPPVGLKGKGDSGGLNDEPTPRIILKRVSKGKEIYVIKNVEEKEKQCDLSLNLEQHNEENVSDSESVKKSKKSRVKRPRNRKVKNIEVHHQESKIESSFPLTRQDKYPKNIVIKEVCKTGSSPKKRKRSSPKIPSKRHKNNSSQVSSQNRVSLKQETVSVTEITEASKKSYDRSEKSSIEKIVKSPSDVDPYNFDDERDPPLVSFTESRQKKVSSKLIFQSCVPHQVKKKDDDKCRKRKIEVSHVLKKGPGDSKKAKASQPNLERSSSQGIEKNASVIESIKKSHKPDLKLTESSSKGKCKVPGSSVPPQLEKIQNKSRKLTNELYPKVKNSTCGIKKANDSPQKLKESQLGDIEKKRKVIESITKNNKPPIKQTEGSSQGKFLVPSKELIKISIEKMDGNKSEKETYVKSGNETYVKPGNETYIKPGNETYVKPGNETYVKPGNETNVRYPAVISSSCEFKKPYLSSRKSFRSSQPPQSEKVDIKSGKVTNVLNAKLATSPKDLKKAKDLSKNLNGSHLPGIINSVSVTKSSEKSNKPQSKQMKGTSIGKVPSGKLYQSSVPPQLLKVDNKSRKITNELYPKLINSSCDLKKANDSPQKPDESLLRGIEKKEKVNESIKKNKPFTKPTKGSSKVKVQVSSEESNQISISCVERVDGNKSGNETNVSYPVVTSCSSEFKEPYDSFRNVAESHVSGTVNSVRAAKSSKKSNKLPTEQKKGASKVKVKDAQPILNQSLLKDIEKNLCVIESVKIKNKLPTEQKKGASKAKFKVTFEESPTIIEPSSKKVQKVDVKKTVNDTYELYPTLTDSASDSIKANVSSEDLPKSIMSSPQKVQKVDDKKTAKDTKDLDVELTSSTSDLNKPKKKPARRKRGTRKRKGKRVKKSPSSAASNVKKSGDNNSGKKANELTEMENSNFWPSDYPLSNFNRRKHVEQCKKPKIKPTEVPRSRKIPIPPRVRVSSNIPLEADHSVYGTRLPSLRVTELLSAHAQAQNTLNTLPKNVSKNAQDKAELFIKNILLTIKEQRSKKPELTGTPINMDDLALALKVHLVPFPP